jgi:hypothetical protein
MGQHLIQGIDVLVYHGLGRKPTGFSCWKWFKHIGFLSWLKQSKFIVVDNTFLPI